MKAIKAQGLKVKAGIKAGALRSGNHNATALRIKSGLKAGAGIYCKNHNLTFFGVTG